MQLINQEKIQENVGKRKKMFFKQLITTTALLITHSHSTNAIVMRCEFQMFKSELDHIPESYTCTAVQFETTFKDRTLQSVTGLHDVGKSNADVKMLYMFKQNCRYIPRNISSFFPNLEVLYIKDSNLQHLLSGDLDGLTNLLVFDVSFNPIDYIGTDFFTGHSSILVLSFHECHIKKIGPGAFDDLMNLTEIHLHNNYCIDLNLKFWHIDLRKFVFGVFYAECNGYFLTVKSKDEEVCLENLRNQLDLLEDENLIEDESNDINRISSSFPSVLLTFTIFSSFLSILMCLMLCKIYKNLSPDRKSVV